MRISDWSSDVCSSDLLSELQTKFEEHLMDALQAWGKQVDDDATLAGMTDEAKQAARERAKVKELERYWLTLDFQSYHPVISYADHRALHPEVYEAYVTPASDRGPTAGPVGQSEEHTAG